MGARPRRRMRFEEAMRLAPLYFLGIFGVRALADFLFEEAVDWLDCLAVAVGVTVIMSLANMIFRVKAKYP